MQRTYHPYQSKLTDQVQESIRDFTDSFHIEVNEKLRGKSYRNPGRSRWTAEDNSRVVRDLDEAIANSPGLSSDTELWRGVDDVNFKPGQVFTDKAYTSTTVKKDVAGFFGSHIVRILVPKGTKGLYVGKDFSENPEEAEFLLSRGMRYRVVSSDTEDVPLNVRGRPMRDPKTVTVLELLP